MPLEIIMTFIFPPLDFLPFAVPRYWLFKDKLRIPFRTVMTLIVLLSCFNSIIFYFLNVNSSSLMFRWLTVVRYLFALVQMILSFSLVKENFLKQLFVYILILSYAFFIFGNSNYITTRFFPQYIEQYKYTTYNILRILFLILTYPFFVHFLKVTIRPALVDTNITVWKSIWIMPLFTTLFGMLYCTVDNVFAVASWQFLFSRYLMLAGSFYMSHNLLKLLKESKQQTLFLESMKFMDNSIKMQQEQYRQTSEHLGEMRVFRHNLRQHLAVIHELLSDGQHEELAAYITDFDQSIPAESCKRYCVNLIVNSILIYYAELANKQSITFEAEVSYPQQAAISDINAAVLFGNMLENALEACMKVHSRPRHIRLTVTHSDNRNMMIALDNTFEGDFQNKAELYISSKNGQPGIGLLTIEHVAQSYDGFIRVLEEDNYFKLSVFIGSVTTDRSGES